MNDDTLPQVVQDHLARLLEEHYPKVHKAIQIVASRWGMINARDSASEATQAAAADVLGARTFDPQKGTFGGYFFSAANNALQKIHREQVKMALSELDDTVRDRLMQDPESALVTRDRVSRLLNGLSPERRRYFLGLYEMKERWGFSWEEIEKHHGSGASAGSLKVSYHRMRQELKGKLR